MLLIPGSKGSRARWLLTSTLLVTCIVGGRVAEAATVTYYYVNPQGTVLAKADSAGNILSETDYRSYGSPALGVPEAGPGYGGHVDDPDTGLVYMQQRYYDPSIGRFLSVDSVKPDANTVGSFNRYTYAQNNPYTFIDPDGRYTCDASVCAVIKQYVAKLQESRDHLKRSDQRAVDKILKYVGTEGSSGPHYVPAVLPGIVVAETDQKGTTKIDVDKAATAEQGAGYIGHEARHDLDTIERGHLAGAAGLEAVGEVEETERNAYSTQALIAQGLGLLITKNQQAEGVKGSVEQWTSHQAKPAPTKPTEAAK